MIKSHKVRIAIFASGKGSNFKAIAGYFKNHPHIEVSLLICDVENAPCLDIARECEIPTQIFCDSRFRTKWEQETELKVLSSLSENKIDYIVLAGFMRVLKFNILKAYPDKILNIHPSLLPSFKGLDAIKQAFDYGVKITGCTVHIVNREIDGGKILGQKAVTVLEEDTCDTLKSKMHVAEHDLFPVVIEKYINQNMNKDLAYA